MNNKNIIEYNKLEHEMKWVSRLWVWPRPIKTAILINCISTVLTQFYLEDSPALTLLHPMASTFLLWFDLCARNYRLNCMCKIVKPSSNLKKIYVCVRCPEDCILNDKSGKNSFTLRDFDLKSSLRMVAKYTLLSLNFFHVAGVK